MTLNRRQFTLGAAAGWLAGPWAASPAWASSQDRGGYVDVHTHIGQTWNTQPPLTAEQLLHWMDAHRVEQAVVLPLVSPESSAYLLTSEFVLAATVPHRDRLIPFCCVDPRTSYQGGRRGLVDMLGRYQESGARGFGEHKPGVAIDHPLNMELYAACAELGLPVLFHLDAQRNMDAPGLPGLERVLRAHPDVVFIGHGPGWWASLSAEVSPADLGGYPRGKVAPGGAIDRLMSQYDNIFGDLSAGSGANAIRRDAAFGREFLIRRADRLMFGTDFLAPGQAVPQFDLFEQELSLPDEVRRQLYRDNARRLLAGENPDGL